MTKFVAVNTYSELEVEFQGNTVAILCHVLSEEPQAYHLCLVNTRQLPYAVRALTAPQASNCLINGRKPLEEMHFSFPPF